MYGKNFPEGGETPLTKLPFCSFATLFCSFLQKSNKYRKYNVSLAHILFYNATLSINMYATRPAARALRTGQIGRMGEDVKHHAAAHGNAAAPPTETDGARKRNGKKDGTGTGNGIGIGIGNGTGIGNNNRNWNYRLLHRKTNIGAESGTLTAPKNRNPDETENGADRRRYAPKNNYGARLYKIDKRAAITLCNIPSC